MSLSFTINHVLILISYLVQNVYLCNNFIYLPEELKFAKSIFNKNTRYTIKKSDMKTLFMLGACRFT